MEKVIEIAAHRLLTAAVDREDADAIAAVAALPETVWYDPSLQQIARGICELVTEGSKTDLVSLLLKFDALKYPDNLLDRIDRRYGGSPCAGEDAAVLQAYFKEQVWTEEKQRMITALGNGITREELRHYLADSDILEGCEDSGPRSADVGRWTREDPPLLDFIFDGVLPVGTIAGIDAQGGIGKGWITQELIVSACIGRALLPSFRPVSAMPVLWIESEDPENELHRRYKKIAVAFDLSEAEQTLLAKNLHVFPDVRFPLVCPAEGTATRTAQYQWLAEQVKRLQPRFIVIDPRSHFFGGDENDNVQVGGFMGYLADLTKHVRGGAAIWVNHHVAKHRQDDADSAAGRGASAGRDAQRVLFSMNTLTVAECRAYGISNADLFVKLTNTKSNWVARRSGTILIQRDPHTLSTGGVLREVDAESRAKEVKEATAKHMGTAIANWIGDNPDALSVTDLWNEGAGKDFRDAMKAIFSSRATKPVLREAILQAIEDGLVAVEKVKVDGRRKAREVPKSLNGNAIQKLSAG